MRDEDDISDDIEQRDERIYIHHLPLLTPRDKDIGIERWDEVDEKYPSDDTKRIDRTISKHSRMDELWSRDDTYDPWREERQKEARGYTSDEEEWEGMARELRDFRIIFFLYSTCEDGEERVQKYRPIHHPDFDELHRKGVERDGDICDFSRLHDREEDGIDFEKYDIQKECYSVGKWYADNMLDILTIPRELDTVMSTRIPPCQCGHEDIACESCEHDEGEFPLRRHTSRSRIEDTREEDDHAKCQEFPARIRNERKLCTQGSLEIAHDGTIHESCEGEEWGDSDADIGSRSIVSWQKWRDSEGESEDEKSWGSTKCEHIRADLLDHLLVVFILRELSDGDGIESEIRDDGEYREIVIYLRVETIARDVEIVREHLDHHDRDKGCEEFGSYLSERVGIYFPSGHGGSIEKRFLFASDMSYLDYSFYLFLLSSLGLFSGTSHQSQTARSLRSSVEICFFFFPKIFQTLILQNIVLNCVIPNRINVS